MKTRFSTLDLIAIIPELKAKLCTGWRVNQVFDCDHTTYLLKLNKSIIQMKKDDDPVSVDEVNANKMGLIIESGVRIHSTDFDWPKPHAPSQFATKLRKSIRNKRIDDIRQVGIDRIVDIQFGTNLAACHLFVELYDKGNLILTDHEYQVIAFLRWLKNKDPDNGPDLKIGQIYKPKVQEFDDMTVDRITEVINNANILLGGSQNRKKRNKVKINSDQGLLEINLKDLLNPYVIYGSSILDDKLVKHLTEECGSKLEKPIIKIQTIDERGTLNQQQVQKYALCIKRALDDANEVLTEVKSTSKSFGYIIQTIRQSGIVEDMSKSTARKKDQELLTTNVDFYPIKSCAERRIRLESDNLTYQEFESFDKAVDVYFCNMESQKIDSQAVNAEKEAMKKLKNLKISQGKRLEDLATAQKDDEERARFIELNSEKVESALLVIRSMIANRISWNEIWDTIKQAQAMKDPIASLITSVRFDRNEFTMKLRDPYVDDCESGEDSKVRKQAKPKYRNVDIDIALSAYANARKFFVKRRTAVNKEKKTVEVAKKAFKNVERKTKEMLKEVVVKTNITKARKRFWFENFYWFISNDGYLVVAGRDAEQNEMLVKRYMKKNDIYVHADIHGGSTVIIKNEFPDRPIPPKTIDEAGTMAVCYSSAWDTKLATISYWVYPDQVSKTPQTGEYLTLGAFMIRGKKNFLPLANLVLGFGFIFKLGDESIERRVAKRMTKKDLLNDQIEVSRVDEASTPGSDDHEGSSSDELATDITSMQDPTSQDAEDHINHGDQDRIENEEEEEDVDLDDENTPTEHRLIDTITESPASDDVILYAIPMCGPYSSLQSFKYKVKVVPGTNKRGKAAKACLGLFLHDKNGTQRERDLLRSLRDQDYARNIPNNVKISAANLKTIIKRKPKRQEVRLPVKV